MCSRAKSKGMPVGKEDHLAAQWSVCASEMLVIQLLVRLEEGVPHGGAGECAFHHLPVAMQCFRCQWEKCDVQG